MGEKPLIEWFAKKDSLLLFLSGVSDGPYRFLLCAFWLILMAPSASLVVTAGVCYPRGKVTVFACGFILGIVLFILGSFLVASFESHYIRAGPRVRKWQPYLRNSLRSFIDSKRCLFLTSEGTIGSSSHYAQIGDQICYLVGCMHPVLLREVRIRGIVGYRVVEATGVHISERNEHREKFRKEYEEFMYYTKSTRRAELLQKKKQEGWEIQRI